MCVVLIMAQWLSWLERRPVTAEVEGSSPFWVVCNKSFLGILAQLGEHLPYKQRVIGSSPIGPIETKNALTIFICRCGAILDKNLFTNFYRQSSNAKH